MTIEKTADNKFLNALQQLEGCLESPVIPGELPGWLQEVRRAHDEVGEWLRQEIEESHRAALKQITQQDLELAARVEHLAKADLELLVEWQRHRDELSHLCRQAERAEPNEALFVEWVGRFGNRALDFIIQARKQDAAITTWLLEAFDRDRGNVD